MNYTSNTYNDNLKYVKSNTSQYAVVVKHDPTTETVKPKPKTVKPKPKTVKPKPKTVKSKPTIAKPMTSKPITAKPMEIKPNVALYVNDIPTTDHLITSKPVTSKSKPMVMKANETLYVNDISRIDNPMTTKPILTTPMVTTPTTDYLIADTPVVNKLMSNTGMVKEANIKQAKINVIKINKAKKIEAKLKEERDKLEKEKQAKEKVARDKKAKERQAMEKLAREKQARDKQEKEKQEKERQAMEKLAREQKARENLEKEKLAREAREKEAKIKEAKAKEARIKEEKEKEVRLKEEKAKLAKIKEEKAKLTKKRQEKIKEARIKEAKAKEAKIKLAKAKEAKARETRLNEAIEKKNRLNEARLKEARSIEAKLNEDKAKIAKQAKETKEAYVEKRMALNWNVNKQIQDTISVYAPKADKQKAFNWMVYKPALNIQMVQGKTNHTQKQSKPARKKHSLVESKELFNSITVNDSEIDTSTIPKYIFQTWKHALLSNDMRSTIIKLRNQHNDFQCFLYDDSMCRDFIKNNFSSDILSAFDTLVPGAYKADLWRYCILYKYGGVYMDIKLECINHFNLNSLIHEECFPKDIPRVQRGIWQGLLICKPQNKWLEKCIHTISWNVKYRYYGISALSVTGPHLMYSLLIRYFNIDIYNYSKVKLVRKHRLYLYYNGKPIMQYYNQYSKDKKDLGAQYGSLWGKRMIYKT